MNDGCTHLAIRSCEPGEDWCWCYLDQVEAERFDLSQHPVQC